MPGQAEQILWYFAIGLHLWLVIRLSRFRLISRYPAVFAALLLQILRSLWLAQYLIDPASFNAHRNEYGLTVLFTEPVLIAARAAAVLELVAATLKPYRGLSVLSRTALLTVLCAVSLVALVLHWPEFSFANEPYHWLRAVYLLETTVYSTLLLTLLLLALFVLYHPAPIPRNLLAHGVGFSVYLLSSAAAVWLRNQDATQWTRAASTLRLVLTVAGLVAWSLLLSARGEEESVNVHLPLSPETERQVLARLNALNSALQRKS